MARWKSLSGREKLSFVKSAMCLTVIKAGLVFLPFSTFRKFFDWFSKSKTKKEISQQEIKQTVWAVASAAHHLPFELLCLPQALATKFLLREVPFLTLEIGVAIDASKTFQAHAWVEKNGSFIIGDWDENISYQRLWVWK
ncbi:lasso peptide biosynthesis B2 protein [Dyadobacter psychrotolerans]|nr:lasso peptide biosynthesis B2 protein [Dyadobacter psychrotolerans]